MNHSKVRTRIPKAAQDSFFLSSYSFRVVLMKETKRFNNKSKRCRKPCLLLEHGVFSDAFFGVQRDYSSGFCDTRLYSIRWMRCLGLMHVLFSCALINATTEHGGARSFLPPVTDKTQFGTKISFAANPYPRKPECSHRDNSSNTLYVQAYSPYIPPHIEALHSSSSVL